jgi:hypothetical protein
VFVAVRVGGVTRRVVTSRDIRQRTWTIVRGIRLRHVLPVPLVLTAVLAVAQVLWLLPPLRWGWWTALGGLGNPVLGTTERNQDTTFAWLVPLVFVLLLLPALPLFAEAEERRFRAGAETWSTRKRIWRGIQFGSVHALIGIPIAVALALSVGGWWFTYRYVKGGLLESTRAHTAYNGVIIAILLVALATGGVT